MNRSRTWWHGATGAPTALILSIALAIGLTTVARAGAAPPETLDLALLKQAPAILEHLKGRGFTNVGVLKFRVKKGDGAASDRVGTLNGDLATRLEIALVLASDPVNPAIGIVRDAGAVAAMIPEANHLTRPGRQALFRARYPLAWGGRKVKPDAFVTGVVELRPDLRRMIVVINTFDREGAALEKVVQFDASTDPPTLAAAGESFTTRGFVDDGKIEIVGDRVAEAAARVKSASRPNPLQDPEAPVALEVTYDGRSVPIEFRGGEAFVREPAEGQSVRFLLRKRDRAAERYGVVLLVNGLNTLGKERLAPVECRKWVLSADHPVIEVRGFQSDAATAESFRVLSTVNSRKNRIHYGPEVGTIGLVVFRERKGPTPPLPSDDEGEDVATITRGVMPADPPLNIAALQAQLRQGATRGQTGGRGLVVEGIKIGAATRTVEFQPDPTPTMAATILYFGP